MEKKIENKLLMILIYLNGVLICDSCNINYDNHNSNIGRTR